MKNRSDTNGAKLSVLNPKIMLVEPVETFKKRDFAVTGTSLRQAQGTVFYLNLVPFISDTFLWEVNKVKAYE